MEGIVTHQDKLKAQYEANKKFYEYHYARFINHKHSLGLIKKTQEQLKHQIKFLNEAMKYPPKELEFFDQTCEVLIKARKVIQWTHAVLFYFGDENKLTGAKKQQ